MNNWTIYRRVNLANANIVETVCNIGRCYVGDVRAHEWIVKCDYGMKAADLSGYAARGYFIRSDNATVIVDGTISGNTVSLVLDKTCYAISGQLSGILRLVNTQNGQVVTIDAIVMYLVDGTTDAIVDPGEVIPSLEELLARIETLKEATDAANSAAGIANAAASKADAATNKANASAAKADSTTAGANTAAERANAAAAEAEKIVVEKNIATKDYVAEQIDAMEIGGRNLIRGTRAMNGYYHSSIVTFSTDAEGFAVASWAKASSAAWTYLSNPTPLTPLSVVRNKTVTVSFDVRTSEPDAYNADSTHGLAVVFNTSDPATAAQRKYRVVGLYKEPLSTQWRRIAVTRELTDNFFNSGSGAINEATAFQIAIDNYSVYPMDVRKIKVELGNKATDWTPAPEDIQPAIFNPSGTVQLSTDNLRKLAEALKQYL